MRSPPMKIYIDLIKVVYVRRTPMIEILRIKKIVSEKV
jgi:hypothetical protein